jgi:hypothetical protein
MHSLGKNIALVDVLHVTLKSIKLLHSHIIKYKRTKGTSFFDCWCHFSCRFLFLFFFLESTVSDGETSTSKLSSSMTKKERYFWQYNVQAKGPKGQRLVLKTRLEDPHVLNEVTDPVFSPECSVRGIKHR